MAKAAAWPYLTLMTFMAAMGAGLYLWKGRHALPEPTDYGNPAQLKTALVFGSLYAVILFGVAAAREHLSTSAIYVIAAVSGLTDVDAITLSTAEITKDNGLALVTAWRVILLASLSNLAFKAISAAVLGTRELAMWIGILFSASIVAGTMILLMWT